ncbi:MAG: acyl-CoA mutase large subunit family protein [Sporomusaceae bacterium]|nr:acyl-CoA mutase large subunit family protein [Sporomusaceae bacterium]
MCEETSQQMTAEENLFQDFAPATYEEWKLAAEKALKGAPFDRKMMTKTYEEITLKPIYRQEDLGEGVFADSMPGSAPFVRSVKTDGYLQNSWLIAQECNQSQPQEVNAVLKNELRRGLEAVHLRLDTASSLCLDPDTAPPEQIADQGVSVCSLRDIEQIFAGLDISAAPLRIECGASALPILALLAAYGEKQLSKSLNGAIVADPIGALAKGGSLDTTLDALYDQMAATIKWAAQDAPQLRTTLAGVSSYHDAGANAVQELAFAVATAVEYAREMDKRGIEFAAFAQHLQFGVSLGANMFMELAKVRALRLLWSQVCAAYGTESAACAANIHARTSFFTKTIYDPYVNLLRTTTESFAGAVGGVDSMHVGAFDEIARRADEFSRRIARNTQIMLQKECNLLQPIDPAGGSWYIETITEDLARKAWELFAKIEAAGGMVSALTNELPQKETAKTYAARMANLGNRKNVIVGTNSYANLGEKLLAAEPADLRQREIRIQEIRELKKKPLASTEIVSAEERAAAKTMLAAIKAAAAGCTSGEIYGALKETGANTPVIKPLTLRRNAEIFENLRQATENYVAKTGDNVRVFSANLGPIPQHKARADFSRGFFEVGAFQVIGNDGFKTVEEAAEAAAKENPDVVVICSTDKTYPELVPPLAKLLKEKIAGVKIFLAGQAPPELRPIYTEAGVDDFIFMGADCYKVLAELQARKGITA